MFSPLAVPVMLGNRPPSRVYGEASDELLAEAADETRQRGAIDVEKK